MRTVCFALVMLLFLWMPRASSQSVVDAHTVALWHFDEGHGDILHDASPYHNDGEIHNCRWVPGKFSSALHFDGLTSYVILPNSASLQPLTEFTLEAWLSLDTFKLTTSPYGSAGGVLSNLGPYPSGGGYEIGWNDPGGYAFDDRSANSISNGSGFTTIPRTHEFNHLAYVYQQLNSGVIIKTYLNGTLTDSTRLSAPIQYDRTPNFYIGTNMDGRAVGHGGIREFPGTIDEIRISNVARHPGEFDREEHPVSIHIVDARLGRNIRNRMVVADKATFPKNSNVYLWMRLIGGYSKQIIVTWKTGSYSHNTTLMVGGNPWRTWASKIVRRSGDWTVTVSDAAGNVLKKMSFKVE